MSIEPQPVTGWPSPAYSIGVDYAFAQDDYEYEYVDDYIYRIDDNRMAVVVFASMDSAKSFCEDANQRNLTECPLVVVEQSLHDCYKTFNTQLLRMAENEPQETLLVWMSPTSVVMRRTEATFHYAEAVLVHLHSKVPPDDRYPELTERWGSDSP